MDLSSFNDDCSAWNRVPDIVLIRVLEHLCWRDRLNAGLTCRRWLRHLNAAALWRRFTFQFSRPADHLQIPLIARHGSSMRDVTISFDPASTHSRESASGAVQQLSSLCASGPTAMRRLSIRFVREPPTAYRWSGFTSGLATLLRSAPSLTHIDLSGYDVNFDDSLLRVVGASQACLERLNIQNRCLVTLVTPNGLKSMLTSCRRLVELSVRQASLSDDCLEALLEDGRSCLARLDVALKGQEKFTADLSPDSWAKLSRKCPDLEVSFAFDSSCPVDKLLGTLKAGIRVTALNILTQSTLHEELRHVGRAYGDTLRVLVVDVEPGAEFDEALLEACASCSSLRELHVMNAIGAQAQLAIYELLHSRRDVTLRFGR